MRTRDRALAVVTAVLVTGAVLAIGAAAQGFGGSDAVRGPEAQEGAQLGDLDRDRDRLRDCDLDCERVVLATSDVTVQGDRDQLRDQTQSRDQLRDGNCQDDEVSAITDDVTAPPGEQRQVRAGGDGQEVCACQSHQERNQNRGPAEELQREQERNTSESAGGSAPSGGSGSSGAGSEQSGSKGGH